MFNDTNGIPDRRFSIVEYHRSFVEYQHEIASSLEDADFSLSRLSLSMEMIEVKSEPRNEKTTSYRFRTILKLPSYVVLRSTPLYFDSFRNETQAPPITRIPRACRFHHLFVDFTTETGGESLWLHRCQMEG